MGSNELCSAKRADCGADSDYCDEGDRIHESDEVLTDSDFCNEGYKNDGSDEVLIVIVETGLIEMMG